MTGLAEALNSHVTSAHSTKKTMIQAIIDKLDDEDREAFLRALEDIDMDRVMYRISSPAVARILGDAGHKLSSTSVVKYRAENKFMEKAQKVIDERNKAQQAKRA